MLENYGEIHENYLALSGDNSNPNRSIADNTQIGLMGCFNIFVRLFMASHVCYASIIMRGRLFNSLLLEIHFHLLTSIFFYSIG